MGWKAVKEHYDIRHHIVQVTKAGLCIGSAYIHDLIVVSPTGEIVKRPIIIGNQDLDRYVMEIEQDRDAFQKLFASQDAFENNIPIWTYDGAEIIEKLCEIPVWPNVTHDGEMIYENMHSTSREAIIEMAVKNAEAWFTLAVEVRADAYEKLEKAKKAVDEATATLDKLYAERDKQAGVVK